MKRKREQALHSVEAPQTHLKDLHTPESLSVSSVAACKKPFCGVCTVHVYNFTSIKGDRMKMQKVLRQEVLPVPGRHPESRKCVYPKVTLSGEVTGLTVIRLVRLSGNFNNEIAQLVQKHCVGYFSVDPIFPVLSLVWSSYHIPQRRLRWCDRSDAVIEMELDNRPEAVAIIAWLIARLLTYRSHNDGHRRTRGSQG